jgi:hypothetical protein
MITKDNVTIFGLILNSNHKTVTIKTSNQN